MDGGRVDVVGVLGELAAGSRSAREVTEERLEALHAVHEATGAVRFFDDDLAVAGAERLDAAHASSGPVGALHGLPITVKDWVDVAGLPCAGTTDDASRRPAADATAVARLRAAGAVVLAKTAAWTGEGGARVRHPVDPDRTPGGSSTGEGVVVGAGASWLGLGSDSGGSVRLPAAWCGVLGLKPTAGLVPTTGHYPRVGERSDGRTQLGLLGADPELLRLALLTIAGPDGLDPGVPPVPFPPAPPPPDGRRFAVLAPDEEWPCSPAIADAVDTAAARLDAAGLSRAPWTGPPLTEARTVTQGYWDRWSLTGAEVAGQLWDWDRYRRRWLAAAHEVDVLLSPATAIVAPLERPLVGDDYAWTLPASLSGAPALTVPMGLDGDGLPVAVQLTGGHWRDLDLLALAPMLWP